MLRTTVPLLIDTSFTHIMKLLSSSYCWVVCKMNQRQQSCPLGLPLPHRVSSSNPVLVLWTLLSCDQPWNATSKSKFPEFCRLMLSVRGVQNHKVFFFALHPNGQKFSLHGHLPSHARGPSMIQTKVQDSLLSLMDPWISIPLEPRDKASPHLKWVFYNIDESILIYLRTRI